MDTSNLLTSLRDKLIIGAMIVFGIGCLALIAFGKAMESTFLAIITGLFALYKGNPSPPSQTSTTETTVSNTPATSTPNPAPVVPPVHQPPPSDALASPQPEQPNLNQ